MSCGEAHETDCSEVLAEVWLLLDHECGEERDAQLRRHLAECGPCLARYGLEEKVKTLLADYAVERGLVPAGYGAAEEGA